MNIFKFMSEVLMQLFTTMKSVTDKTSAAALNQQEVTWNAQRRKTAELYFTRAFTKPPGPDLTGLWARLTRCCSWVSAAACWARCRPPRPPGRPPPAGAAGPPTSGPTIRCWVPPSEEAQRHWLHHSTHFYTGLMVRTERHISSSPENSCRPLSLFILMINQRNNNKSTDQLKMKIPVRMSLIW